MSAITAQILVGRAHPDRRGIEPTHYLYLSENGKPAWILVSQNIAEPESSSSEKRVTWIPTGENLLEDALLMIAIYVLKVPEIIELAKNYFKNGFHDFLNLSDEIERETLKKLHEKCRHIDDFYKLAITVFEGSTIHPQLKVLEKYKMELEVCTPRYYRLYSSQNDPPKQKGYLTDLYISDEELIAMANDPQIQAEIAAINRDFTILAAMDLQGSEGL